MTLVSGNTHFDLVDYDRRHHIVYIRDLDQGMSITNNAEKVYGHIRTHYGAVRVVYQDTQGNWDEIALETGRESSEYHIVFRPWHGLAWDILKKV